jgi:hypothetical protein
MERESSARIAERTKAALMVRPVQSGHKHYLSSGMLRNGTVVPALVLGVLLFGLPDGMLRTVFLRSVLRLFDARMFKEARAE